MHSNKATSQQPVQEHRSLLAGLGLAIAGIVVLTIIAAMVGGKMHGWKAEVSLLMMAAVPVCTIGTGLALASLVWRKENKSLAQASLWLNGMLAFFAFPLMVYWLLAMH